MKNFEGNYLDMDLLLKEYEPLIKSVQYRLSTYYNKLFLCKDDYEDLEARIQLEFIKLTQEYDATIGVDFPGYIKIHLQQRVFHTLTRLQVVKSKEFTQTQYDNQPSVAVVEKEDEDTDKQMRLIEARNMYEDFILKNKIIPGQKYKSLIEAILYKGMTLEEYSKNYNINIKTARLRLHFVCQKLNNYYEKERLKEHRQYEREHIKKPTIERRPIFIDRAPVERHPIRIPIIRKPIIRKPIIKGGKQNGKKTYIR